MHCENIFIQLALIYNFLSLVKSSVELNSFHPFNEANSCHPKNVGNFPVCKFWSHESPSSFTTECLKPGVLRLQGEYSIIKILCTSDYAIDLFYYGHQPTEAVNVTWSKKVEADTDRQNLTFEMEVLIYSTRSLHNYHNNFETNKTILHAYTRSGNYVIRGIWNTSKETSFHLFLEEDFVKPTFLRNSMTSKPLNKSGHYILPCISSHYNSNTTLFEIEGNSENRMYAKYDFLQGFNVSWLPEKWVFSYIAARNFRCKLQYMEYEDELNFTIPPREPQNVFFGLEELGTPVHGDVEINYKYRIDNNSVIYIAPRCRVQNLNEPNTMLSAIEAHNFAYLRLVREFVLPKFVNQSYTARIGTEKDQLPREIKITDKNSLNGRFGVTFCQSGNEHRLIEYGTSHISGEAIKINYGLDWTKFNREQADIEIFLLLKLENNSGDSVMYSNTMMTFACRVHEAVVVKPTIWYTLRKNGSYLEELIDYNWVGAHSYFTRNMTSDISDVYCSVSFWYSTTWRNISMNLNLIEGQPPAIITEAAGYTFRPNSQHTLNCEADGNPQPKLSWQLNQFDISSNAVKMGKSIILVFQNVAHSHAGEYICIAENRFGRAEQKFHVSVEEEPGVNYGLVVGVPTLFTLILISAVYIYIRRWKTEQIGLTKAEIAEFMQGQTDGVRTSVLNAYAHDFAHYEPYNREFEIPPSKFQIDETTVLGSGAYGTVYKGLVEGVPVAVKTVNKYAEKSYLKALLSELKIMIYLGESENVIKFLGSNTAQLSTGFVYIFIKYYPRGSLEKFLKSNRQNYSHEVKLEGSYTNSFGYATLLSWSKEIARGMEYLRSKKVIHGDLAARNVLLSEDLQAKITDFGLSRQLYDYADYVKKNQEPLPWRWMSIESLRDMSFSTQSDVWSFGITMWEIFSLGEVPYPGFTWTMSFIGELEKGLRMTRPKYGSDTLFELIISECWQEYPNKRPSFQEICEKLENHKVPLYNPVLITNNTYTNV